MKQLDDTRTLNGNAAEIATAILQLNRSGLMTLQPREILIRSRCIDDKKIFVRRSPIDDEVVDDSAIFIQQECVLALTALEFFDVVRQHFVEPGIRLLSRDDQLTHVRNVEDSGVFSHGLMFIHDACVLHRHEPAAERNHLRATPQMFGIEWRSFFRGHVSHALIILGFEFFVSKLDRAA